MILQTGVSMRRTSLVPGLILPLFLFFTAATSLPARAAPAESLTQLSNGLTVYVIRDARFPLVCTRLYVRTGSANENPRFAGISHLLEHMVFKGTDHRPKGQAARDVEKLGGYLNASTGFDKTVYITDMPAAHWRTGMDVVQDMAFRAKLNPGDLESEKNVVISELEGNEDSPMRKLFEDLQTAGLHNTAYGRPIIGYRETVRAITAEDLRAYVKQWYQPRNMTLLVAGDIDPKAVQAHAEKLFGNLKNSGLLPVTRQPDIANAPGGQRVVINKGPWNKVYLGMAFPVPGLRDLRSADLDVLAYLLGGDGTSRFYNRYKYEKQLVDDISVSNMSLAEAGLLVITAQMDAGKILPFWQELTKDLAGLKAGDFKPDALKRAKDNLADEMDRAGETLSGLAAWKGIVQFDLGGTREERNLRFSMNAVDAARLQRAINDWLVPQRARVRVLVPQNAVLPDLEAVLQKNWPDVPVEKTSGSEKIARNRSEILNLGDGRTVILLPDNSVPYISLDLAMPGGNALLTPDRQGLANLAAQALTTGSGKLDAQETERFFSDRAAAVSAEAGLQTFHIALSGPARFTADYFGALGDIVSKPRFDAKEIRREAENMKSAIRQRSDRPLSYLFAKLSPFLYPGGHPYGFDRLGTPENLDRFERKDVQTFWKLQSTQPWVLSVAGDLNREAVLAFAKALPVPQAAAPAVSQPEWGREKRLDLNLPGRNQAHFLQLFKAVPLTHPDAPALMLLQAVISGQSGLLFSSLRDAHGLGYTVTAFYRTMPEAAFMAFYIGTTADKVQQAKRGFADIISDLAKKPLSRELLLAAGNRLQGEYHRSRQSLASRANESAMDAVLKNPQDFRKLLLEKTAALTPADIQSVARKYLGNENLYEITLLP
jgi:zinc protease